MEDMSTTIPCWKLTYLMWQLTSNSKKEDILCMLKLMTQDFTIVSRPLCPTTMTLWKLIKMVKRSLSFMKKRILITSLKASSSTMLLEWTMILLKSVPNLKIGSNICSCTRKEDSDTLWSTYSITRTSECLWRSTKSISLFMKHDKKQWLLLDERPTSLENSERRGIRHLHFQLHFRWPKGRKLYFPSSRFQSVDNCMMSIDINN